MLTHCSCWPASAPPANPRLPHSHLWSQISEIMGYCPYNKYKLSTNYELTFPPRLNLIQITLLTPKITFTTFMALFTNFGLLSYPKKIVTINFICSFL